MLESDGADVELAVWEAAVNAAGHLGGPGWAPASSGSGLALMVLAAPSSRCSDRGQWRVNNAPASGRGWSGGRGLSVISQVSDELSISPWFRGHHNHHAAEGAAAGHHAGPAAR